MAKLFMSYAHEDEEYRNRLAVGLRMLQREQLIEVWHDHQIIAGQEYEDEISRNLEEADVILLLVSPDFLDSDYCYNKEMSRALERHHAGEATVIPVILRHSDWQRAPFSKLAAIPGPNGKPIKTFADIDEAYQSVTSSIRDAVQARTSTTAASATSAPQAASGNVISKMRPRSNNVALPKTFSDAQKDRFLEDCYTFIESFFENSLEDLKERNPGVETGFRKVSSNEFSATVYNQGREVSRCVIKLGDGMGKGITYGPGGPGNGFNEQLRVDSDEHGMFLKSLGMASIGRSGQDQKLSEQGGAEIFWDLLVGNLMSRRR